ncbi:unnamed protein product [Brassica oleracea]|uniref:(rape) hypothetical protein n=1 Tax=Brassica napus TaxID=3708 RepID=A0A816KJF5_BRANA|nr:unnamed protein product [Brassica napus]
MKRIKSFSSERESKRGRREVTEIIINDDALEKIMLRLPWSSACLVEVEEEEDYHISNDEQEDVIVSKSLDGLFCFYGRAYKLVWLHNIKDKNISSCEVFDFGVKEWRHVTSPPDHRIDHNQEATFANGWLYWFTHEKTKLIAFDLHMEMFQVVPNPIVEASSSSSSISMHMCSLDYDRGLVNISVTNGDGMQHVWRLTNHNTGGALLKTNKIFSFDLNKITSTWFEETHYKSSLLSLTAVSKKGNKLMLAKYGSDKLLLYQPLTPNSIMNRIFSYSPSRPSDSVFLHYFPSLACPL